ncbi:MAG: electron transport complex subunit E [Clostridia bacterium]|nr:electron transport complex subunit E [Clostridia bacterium]
MDKKNSVFLNGILYENPTFVQLLGMCPTLAVTTTLANGFGMGLSATAVLIMSNILISLLRKIIPDKVRIAAYIVIIATFVTIVQMVLQAYVPSLYASLGIFIPLIVVNCIILARAEAFASKNGVFRSAVDGLGMGLGFTFALCIISSVREILGQGTILGHTLYGGAVKPISIIGMPPGGFITLGILIAVINFIVSKRKKGDNK